MYLLSSDLISNNKVSLLTDSYTHNLNLKKAFRTRTIGELLLEIINPDNKNVEKSQRNQFYSTFFPVRPTKEEYHSWNGLQVFDLDLKPWVNNENGNIDFLKEKLYRELSVFPWFLWIVKSSSGNGLHIYTKCVAPHHVHSKLTDNEHYMKYWYYISYYTKAMNIHYILWDINKRYDLNFQYEKDKQIFQESPYFDYSTARITTGIKLSYDNKPLINHSFVDLHPAISLTHTINGIYNIEDLMNIFGDKSNKLLQMIDGELRDTEEHESKINLEDIDLSKYVKVLSDISELKVIPRSQLNYHVRYNVCNTLASMLGKEGLPIAHKILDSKGCDNVNEINGFFACAVNNRKVPSKMGLDYLVKCGVISNKIKPEILEPMINHEKNYLRDYMISAIKCDVPDFELKLNNDQYIGNIKDIIMDRISGEYINILNSPPNSGKTHFIKKLAKGRGSCGRPASESVFPLSRSCATWGGTTTTCRARWAGRTC